MHDTDRGRRSFERYLTETARPQALLDEVLDVTRGGGRVEHRTISGKELDEPLLVWLRYQITSNVTVGRDCGDLVHASVKVVDILANSWARAQQVVAKVS